MGLLLALAEGFGLGYFGSSGKKTSLLRRPQAQILPDKAPPIGKVYPISKIAVNFEPLMGF